MSRGTMSSRSPSPRNKFKSDKNLRSSENDMSLDLTNTYLKKMDGTMCKYTLCYDQNR